MRFGRLPGVPHGVQWCFEGDGGGGGSTTDHSGNSGRQNPADVVARYNGDAVRLASDLSASESRNFDLREKNRDLRQENDNLKKQLPGEGAVVLTKEQAALWEGFQKLNLKPEEIETQLAAGQTAQATLTRYERDGVKGVLDEAAEAENLKPGLLKVVAENWNVQMRDTEVVGENGEKKTVKRPYVVTMEGDKEKLTGLRDQLKAKGEDVIASLEADDPNYSGNYSPSNNGHANGDANGHTNGGTPYPKQGGGGGGNNKQVYKPRNRYEHNLPKEP